VSEQINGIKLPVRAVDMGAYAEIQDIEENFIATTRGVFNGVGFGGPPVYWATQIADALNELPDLRTRVAELQAKVDAIPTLLAADRFGYCVSCRCQQLGVKHCQDCDSTLLNKQDADTFAALRGKEQDDK
jgi:hypothetical protein